MEIAIIGAGIGGLTTAIALHRKGYSVRVFEAASHLKPAGAGIVLAQNAVKAFQHLGIADQILPYGQKLDQFSILKQDGKALSKGPLTPNPLFANFAIHRHLLHEGLLRCLKEIPLSLGKAVTGFQEQKDHVILRFADGDTYTTDWVVAADGIHSPIRQQLFPKVQPQYAGYTCWRAVAETHGLHLTHASETWGANGRFGIVPLPDQKVYWFACLTASAQDPQMAAIGLSDLARHFAKFHTPIPEILSQTNPQALLHHDIYDLPNLTRFAHNRILLLGDAAHATTPNMGQGACQAIEDAVFLAEWMAKLDNPVHAFQAFEKSRIARTQGIVKQSRRMGQIAQSGNPLVMGLRNTLLRLVPLSLQQKQLEKILNIEYEV